MKKLIFLIICLTNIWLHCQPVIPAGSPIIGTWQLYSPKKSPGPEFTPETYVGISVFKISAGTNISVAAASYDKKNNQFVNAAEFIAQWDERRLTGIISSSQWPKVTDPLTINVPFEYNSKRDQIFIHVNNPEYGDVIFKYKRISN